MPIELDQNRLLIIGNDGRANATHWKLLQDNPYLDVMIRPADIEINSAAALASDYKVGLTWVSPEAPLVKGIVDVFDSNRLPIVGPNAEAAQLEGDKVYATRFAERNGIPHPASVITNGKEEALDYLRRFYGNPRPPFPDGLVVKYPLLAGGKGVTLPDSFGEAVRDIDEIFNGKFGKVPREVLFQERIIGEELSMMFLSDGKTTAPLLPARDYKRAYDGDKGPNTGGMGSFAPVEISSDIWEQGLDIADRTIKGMALEGHPFKGSLYLGLMIDKKGNLLLLEDNVRLGDPEWQSIVVLMKKRQLLSALKATTNGELSKNRISFYDDDCAVTVVVAGDKYPQESSKGRLITRPKNLPKGVVMFPSGIMVKDDGTEETKGGRIIGVTARSRRLERARALANEFADQVIFDGARHRTDIGKDKQ